jgi:hypothetical protein
MFMSLSGRPNGSVMKSWLLTTMPPKQPAARSSFSAWVGWRTRPWLLLGNLEERASVAEVGAAAGEEDSIMAALDLSTGGDDGEGDRQRFGDQEEEQWLRFSKESPGGRLVVAVFEGVLAGDHAHATLIIASVIKLFRGICTDACIYLCPGPTRRKLDGLHNRRGKKERTSGGLRE